MKLNRMRKYLYQQGLSPSACKYLLTRADRADASQTFSLTHAITHGWQLHKSCSDQRLQDLVMASSHELCNQKGAACTTSPSPFYTHR